MFERHLRLRGEGGEGDRGRRDGVERSAAAGGGEREAVTGGRGGRKPSQVGGGQSEAVVGGKGGRKPSRVGGADSRHRRGERPDGHTSVVAAQARPLPKATRRTL
ncbi:hypothetical protein GCM10010358_57500 [Streptomyces minutiscleroticus]|uniref:Uncharacterized protein n=1 Tax=Streptomyces minutiscleroticus TaxID=68238 RepID=A0A918NUE2_9ACTN|nr:hypothetical protein GCM10010358_57500 [Streptomyces minutiscleroticus]